MSEVANKKINVLVVDDSTLMRRVITDLLHKHPNINVIGYAINGEMALRQLHKLKPDVITLDVEMPLMNGLETLKEINKIRPTPTVMLSSLTKEGADVTIQALELGAVDFVQKPDARKFDLNSVEEELIQKVLIASQIAHTKLVERTQKQIQKRERPVIRTTQKVSRVKTVIIGCSTGGPQALKQIIPELPHDLPAQYLIVQHMPPKFTEMLAQRLDKMSKIIVKEAKDYDTLEAGQALLAPGNFHMCMGSQNKVKLTQEPPVWGVRPAVDMTLSSAARIFKRDLISVILTGMGHDGSRGVETVKKFGGYSIAEHKSTCVIYGMPKQVVESGYVDKVLPLPDVVDGIIKAVYS